MGFLLIIVTHVANDFQTESGKTLLAMTDDKLHSFHALLHYYTNCTKSSNFSDG